MKKLHKILLAGMLAMSVIIGNGALAKAATMNEMLYPYLVMVFYI